MLNNDNKEEIREIKKLVEETIKQLESESNTGETTGKDSQTIEYLRKYGHL